MKLIKWISVFSFIASLTVFADPSNTARLDGRPTEYDGTDLRGTFIGASTWGADATITNLYVTWDETYLYIALQGWENGNKLVVMLDVDPGNGTGATTTTNWTGVGEGYVRYNDVGWQKSEDVTATDFGLDYMFATEGFFHDVLRVTYDGLSFDTNEIAQIAGNSGPNPSGSATDIVALEDSSACDLKGMETRIPWTVLYGTNRFGTVEPGEVIPRGATLRLFANVHNNDPDNAHSSPDTIPLQVSPNASWNNGLLTTDTYIDIPVDQDNDGFPDLAVGDVNAPYLIMLQGLTGQSNLYAMFNEAVTTNTAEIPANWSVNGATPANVMAVQENAVLITMTNVLPSEATQVSVLVSNVEDASGNSKDVRLCFFPTSGGIEMPVTVRFYLETASGLGLSPGASNYYINGSTPPLEWGYPPATSSRLSLSGGSVYYRDVTFPAGTPQKIAYKYSGELSSGTGQGTNNYEAVRLNRFAEVSRELTLNMLGTPMVVTDYLGAAAHPWRDPNDTNNAGYNALYIDARRGDAGVRERTTVIFQLDLSQRDLKGVTRVLILGTDPLRGFNLNNEPTPVSDYPTAPVMTWDTAGLTMYDDGTHGDLVAGDRIYSREWTWSTNGLDSATVSTWPYSLVGSGEFDEPYYGTDFWAARRSPRSFAYKFAVYKAGSGDAFESPSYDVEQFIQYAPTSVVFDAFVWDNPSLPPPPPSNAPSMGEVAFQGNIAKIIFTNALSEAQHGVEISTNLLAEWMNYGHRATNHLGEWMLDVRRLQDQESYRAFAGPPKPFTGVRWDPNPIPETGGVLRIFFNQHSRVLAGERNVKISGSFNGWSTSPMLFMEDGVWIYDVIIASNDADQIGFKLRDNDLTIWSGMMDAGGDFLAYKGTLRATWEPNTVTNGELITITYDAAGGALATATSVYAHVGFDEGWDDTTDRMMTNTAGTVWELAFEVPTNRFLSVNFVFNGNVPPGGGQVWDTENDNGGRAWRAFIAQPEN
jgi:hypothetical protein